MHTKNQEGRVVGDVIAPVVLFGWGEWSKKSWFPVLVTLARRDVLNLTVVERWQVAPKELSALEQERVLNYLPWESLVKSQVTPIWKVAFVVVNAHNHATVIHWLLEKVKSCTVIVCEKPCGESLEEANAIFDACRRRGIILLVADHYLLRPPVQHLIGNPQPLLSIGEMVQITAVMNESKETGPNQGAITDMLIHLLDLLLILFPGAHFAPDTAYIARARHNAHTEDETYTLAQGSLIHNRCSVPYQLECGKQLAEDRKELCFVGAKGRLHLDLISNSLTLTLNHESSKEVSLKWSPSWSYARLILKCLTLSSSNQVPSQQK